MMLYPRLSSFRWMLFVALASFAIAREPDVPPHHAGSWQETERGPQVFLNDGSVLIGDVLSLTTEELVLGDAAKLGRCRWRDVTLPLHAVRGILFQPPAERLERDRLTLQIASSNRRDDELLLVGGESVKGVCLGSQRDPTAEPVDVRSWQTLRFQVRGVNQPVQLSAAKVRGLMFNTTLLQPAKAVRERWLGLSDGNLLAVRAETRRANSVELELAAGIRIAYDQESAAEPAVADSQLSSFSWPTIANYAYPQPSKFEFRPYLSTAWPLGTNTNVLGGRLRQTTGVALQGFGVHAGGTLEFEVPKQAEFFEVETCVDPSISDNGRMQFAILASADGRWKEVARSPTLTPKDDPHSMRVSLAGVTKLRLETDWAEGGDTGDHGNWCYPRFVLSLTK